MPILGQEIFVEDDQEERGGEVILTTEARRQGVYLIGTTGTGKTTLLQSIAYQDMEAGEGLCVIDPHGDMIDELLRRVPNRRTDDVIVFAPGDLDQYEQPLGLNLFDCDRSDPRQRRRVASTIIDTLYKLFFYSWGPRMEDLLRNAILALLEYPDTTFLDLWLMIADQEHREKYTTNLKDAYQQQYWGVQFPRMTKHERDLVEVIGSSLNKISRFLADPLIRNVISQPESAFNLRQMMDDGQILLVNLSKGDLGEDNARLLGAVLVNQVLNAALQRRDTPVGQRQQFHLIVDEYQNFATSSFPTLQSEARKYALDVLVAHQYRDQLDDLNKGSTLNVANFVVMRVSGRDGLELALQFDNTPPPGDWKMEPMYEEHFDVNGRSYAIPARTPNGEPIVREVQQPRRLYNDVQAEKANDLSTLEDYRAICRLFVKRKPKEYFLATFDPEKRPDLYGVASEAMRQQIRQRALTFGRPREKVEAYIRNRIGEDIQFDAVADIPDED